MQDFKIFELRGFYRWAGLGRYSGYGAGGFTTQSAATNDAIATLQAVDFADDSEPDFSDLYA
jgi:hypothetical protein